MQKTVNHLIGGFLIQNILGDGKSLLAESEITGTWKAGRILNYFIFQGFCHCFGLVVDVQFFVDITYMALNGFETNI